MKQKIIDEINNLLISCDTITLKAVYTALKSIIEGDRR